MEGQSENEATSRTVLVSNISPDADVDKIRDFFCFCGEVEDLKVSVNEKAEDGALMGTCTFSSQNSCATALLLSGSEIEGRQIQVSPADGKPQESSGAATSSPGAIPFLSSEQEEEAFSVVGKLLVSGYMLGHGTVELFKAYDGTKASRSHIFH